MSTPSNTQGRGGHQVGRSGRGGRKNGRGGSRPRKNRSQRNGNKKIPIQYDFFGMIKGGTLKNIVILIDGNRSVQFKLLLISRLLRWNKQCLMNFLTQ